MPHTRRTFLRAASVAASLTFIPSWSRAGLGPRVNPSDQLTLGWVGCGKQSIGMGERFAGIPEAKIVAACDVFAAKLEQFTTEKAAQYAELAGGGDHTIKGYATYAELLDHPGLDGIVIVTPDHQHASMAIAALERGYHVYCEKPLAHTVEEGRAMVEAAEASGKIFQTGSMQRSYERFRHAVELIRNGYLGEVTSATVAIGPPPKAFDLEAQPIPDGLDWAAWIGPSVPRPYHQDLAPLTAAERYPNWRGYAEFGGGMITDWGAHMFDIVQWALDRDDSGPVAFYPPGGNDSQEGLTQFYADGFRVDHRGFGRGNAIRFHGSEGTLDVARPFLDSSIPGLVDRKIGPNEQRVYFSDDHERNFVVSALAGQQPICPAETGHRTASVCTLTNIAYRLRRPVRWDPATETIENDRAANKLLGPAYRMSLA